MTSNYFSDFFISLSFIQSTDSYTYCSHMYYWSLKWSYALLTWDAVEGLYLQPVDLMSVHVPLRLVILVLMGYKSFPKIIERKFGVNSTMWIISIVGRLETYILALCMWSTDLCQADIVATVDRSLAEMKYGLHCI